MTPTMLHQKSVDIKHGQMRVSVFDGKYESMIVFESTDGCMVTHHVSDIDLVSIHTMLTDILNQMGVEHA